MGGKSGVRGYTGGLEKHFVASMRRTELEPRAKLKRLYYSVRKSLALTDETRAKYTRKFDTYRKNNASERADQFRALLNEVGKDFGYPDLGTKLLSRKSIYRRDIKVIAKKAAQGIAEILLEERYRKEVEKYARDYCVASETKQRIEPTNTCPYGTTNQSGWIWIEHRDNETWSTCDRLVEDEGKFIQGSIEFRIAVTPTKDNLAKAYAVLRSLANREDCPIHVMKMVDAEQLEKTDYAGWHFERMEIAEHDQRGKEICCYVSYKIAGRGKPGSCGLVADADAHKSFMARLLRGLIAAGVEGIAYYPSSSADRSLSSPLETAAGAIPHLFTYLDYSSGPKVFSYSDEYEKFGWQDPLKDVQFTLEDYQEVGISRESLETIRRGQREYLKGHFAGALTTMKRRLENLENEPADPTGGVVDQHVGEALARFAASDFAGGSYGDERLMAIASKNPDEFLAICRGFEHLAHEARIARDQFGLDLNAQMAAGQFEVSASENLIKV